MNRENCDTLEKVYQKTPSSIPWADIERLFEAIANEYGGSWDYVPGGWLTLTLPHQANEDDTTLIPYSPVVYRGMIEIIKGYLVIAGIAQCK
jgi:hypothetical protein